MFVWQVLECEEYSFQVNHGLWSTEERAVADARIRCGERVGAVPITTLRLSEEETLVLAGEWTVDSWQEFRRERGSYWWYRAPFNHVGAFGVFRVEVQE